MSVAFALTDLDLARLPGRRDEDWRWTDLRGLIRQPVEASPELGRPAAPGGAFAGLAPDEFVFANGQLNDWPQEALSPALGFHLHDAPGSARLADAMPMARLAGERHLGPPLHILTVREGQSAVVRFRFLSEAEGTGHHLRLGVMLEAGARAVVLESYEGRGSDYLSNVALEFYVADGASLERIAAADEAETAISVSSAEVHLKPGATFAQTLLVGGAKRQRFETQLSHPGGGASVRADGLYLVGGRRHADLTSVVTHEAVDGTTSQLIKGVVRDQGRGVFQGRIVVAEGADRTDARMGHHALILSDRAEVDAKPELLIFADDVQCAHGNTVGRLDEDALFYAMQRGLAPEAARALLTEAFVGEVVDRIRHEGAREAARAWVSERLGGV
ncbi:MAG TPA: Fe-S cluster assembly protein SufD [Phenylobacterium sp.]|nr:Fe-S cluster assembly protein SufD [Phenylobacterium sp.]